ncbi:DUF6456 domain-containing protein [Fodinicurvata sp. EGI_FJ10296]|uniref:DUF6456 domain-containing protein n=1 Tax=Fodinicurvata sp. EGI_FJ10296 TaxID=3231908 RepID=UPI003453D22E
MAKTKTKSRKQRIADTAPGIPGALPRDTGPAERWNHGDKFVEEASDIPGINRRRVANHGPLDRYLSRGQITQEQFDAGDWLRRRYQSMKLAPGAAALDPAKLRVDCGNRPAEITWNQSEAHRDVLDALRCVGPELSPVLIRVCGLGDTASGWATGNGYSGRPAEVAGMVTLRHALSALARFV